MVKRARSSNRLSKKRKIMTEEAKAPDPIIREACAKLFADYEMDIIAEPYELVDAMAAYVMQQIAAARAEAFEEAAQWHAGEYSRLRGLITELRPTNQNDGEKILQLLSVQASEHWNSVGRFRDRAAQEANHD
jgi:hypothetical protein